MPAPSVCYVRINDAVRGPFTRDQLRTLGEVGTITPETEVSVQPEGPWAKLQDAPDCVEIFPPRRQFQFKTREFENVNQPPAPAAAGPAPAGTPPPLLPPAAVDVMEIVRENTRIQTGYEKPLDLTPPPNRRRRDYLILMVAANGFFVTSLILGRGNASVMVFSFSGIVITSAALTWVMYGVMGRY